MATLSTPLGQLRITRKGMTYVKVTKSGFMVEDFQKHTQKIKEHFGDKKHRFVMNFRNVTLNTSKEIRDYMASAEYHEITQAVAWLINDSVGKIMGTLISNFVKPPYHFKIFFAEKEAMNWLEEVNTPEYVKQK